MIFETTVLTFFGPRIKKIWGNNMWDDWKLYDQATYIGVRSKLAIILQPRVYLAYRRMMVAFEKWIDSGSTEWPATDGIRNEQWGARMNWERDRLGVECGFSLRGRACLQAGFLWV
jgi:oxysterol 7-alpha-hydroxylase